MATARWLLRNCVLLRQAILSALTVLSAGHAVLDPGRVVVPEGEANSSTLSSSTTPIDLIAAAALSLSVEDSTKMEFEISEIGTPKNGIEC